MHYSANSLNDTFQTGALNSPQELNVYLETPDGLGFEGKVAVAKLDMNTDLAHVDITQGFPGHIHRQSWDLTLSGIGGFAFMQGVNMAKRIAARFLPQEWVCKFCERANPIDQYQCQSCGWYRGIIADVVQEMGIWRPRE